MGKIFVHCGLHKTGSTALQDVFGTRADELRKAGFFFPRTGVPADLSGQHNIAWQIAKDRRFGQSTGDLDALAAEIDGYEGNIILSSEDFESSLAHTDRLLPLLQLARSAGRSIVFIVYFRNQNSYLESLYQEMLKHGFGDEYADSFNSVYSNGVLHIKDWEFHFDYWRIATILSSFSDVTIVFRNYHALLENSLIVDFCSMIGLTPSILGSSVNFRANVRAAIITSLARFYQNRVGRDLDHYEKEALSRLCSGKDLIGLGSSKKLRSLLENKFSASNAQLFDRYNLPCSGFLPSYDNMVPPARALDIQKLFSSETENYLRNTALLLAGCRAGNYSAADTEVAEHVEAWSSWVRLG
ncbi:MAG: hypothetical protein ABFD97_23320 [Syntrophobacter sp.]